MMKKALFIAALLIGQITMKAQSGWGATPADSVKCWENYNNFGHLANSRSYLQAFPFWYEVYKNCPSVKKPIYQLGPRVIEAAIKEEKDPAKKAEYINVLIEQYDKRLEYFPGKDAYVHGKKANSMRKYQPEKLKEAYAEYQVAFEKDYTAHDASVVNGYFATAVKLFNSKDITVEELFTVYNQVSEAIEVNNNEQNRIIEDLAPKRDSNQIDQKELKKLTRAEKILSGYDQLEVNVNKMITPLLTCTQLEKMYNAETFAANKGDATWLRRAIKMMSISRVNAEGEREDCTNNPIFFESAEALFALEPSTTAARGMGNIAFRKSQYSKAIEFYKQAAEQEADPKKRADDFLRVAQGYMSLGNGSLTKTYALKAAGLKKEWGDPYLLLAQAYAAAEGTCGNNVVEKKAVLYAAIAKANYAKSIDPSVANKAAKLVAYYNKRLPDKSTAFQLNYKDGDKYTIGCWINETVTLRF